MPNPAGTKIKFSKVVSTPSGKKTLGLYGTKPKSKKIEFIEYRVCKQTKDGHFKCPRGKEREKLKKEIGL